MKKTFLSILLTFSFITPVFAASEWEGKWEYERYNFVLQGGLIITNCTAKECDFEIKTFNGAHTCEISGRMKINKTKAVFTEKTHSRFSDERGFAEFDFDLDPEKRIIKVIGKGDTSYYCGIRGHYEGSYENIENPDRFQTSFDCWKKDISDIEKEICAAAKLSFADLETTNIYPSPRTPEWYAERDKCGPNIDCLWEFYKKKIKEQYQKQTKKTLNLYEYLQPFLKDNPYTYPYRMTLINDYLHNNLTREEYLAWLVTIGDIQDIQATDCPNCYFRAYGIPGLYTSYESAMYMDTKGLWLAFISEDLKDPEHIVVYMPADQTEDDMPALVREWVEDHKESHPAGAKYKHFKSSAEYFPEQSPLKQLLQKIFPSFSLTEKRLSTSQSDK